MIGIYKITNPKGKIYIGQSIDIKERWRAYNPPSKILDKRLIGNKLYNSLNKYGPENHKFEVIEECLFTELNEREIYWINFYKSCSEGLNITEGGLNFKHTEETKEKIRKKALGRKMSQETKEKIGKSKIGNKYNVGRKASEETRLKMSKSYKCDYSNPERCSKISKALSKPILQYDLEGNFIKEWESITEARKNINGDLGGALSGRNKSSGGFLWKYKNNIKHLR